MRRYVRSGGECLHVEGAGVNARVIGKGEQGSAKLTPHDTDRNDQTAVPIRDSSTNVSVESSIARPWRPFAGRM